mmetsp:Transcript_9434/g.29328  ORF Transcript_9434/g.29328 Transcript_9434/m.29328 type:complete len:300 (+) Transcript_9434:708-1607(+)
MKKTPEGARSRDVPKRKRRFGRSRFFVGRGRCGRSRFCLGRGGDGQRRREPPETRRRKLRQADDRGRDEEEEIDSPLAAFFAEVVPSKVVEAVEDPNQHSRLDGEARSHCATSEARPAGKEPGHPRDRRDERDEKRNAASQPEKQHLAEVVEGNRRSAAVLRERHSDALQSQADRAADARPEQEKLGRTSDRTGAGVERRAGHQQRAGERPDRVGVVESVRARRRQDGLNGYDKNTVAILEAERQEAQRNDRKRAGERGAGPLGAHCRVVSGVAALPAPSRTRASAAPGCSELSRAAST